MRRTATNPWVVLVLICLAQLMVVLDATIVNVALPSIQTDLHLSGGSLQWIVNAYTLVFGGFLLLGGRLGDLLGRKRLFLVGLVVFTGASLLDVRNGAVVEKSSGKVVMTLEDVARVAYFQADRAKDFQAELTVSRTYAQKLHAANKKLSVTAPLKGERQHGLSARELEVLQLICDGYSNREIAAKLDLSANTVAVHRANIMNTLGVHNTAELVVYAIQHGLVTVL